ncbi:MULTISPECIES: bifunctional 2-methylcitrate synthase/citrate synthase [Cryobacterium]|uniref:Citrate synthase n=1 Tax=Cryobacterium breve TaxID=1259258 RepID=A0ABY2J4D8_9MICO|nr:MULTISPECIES: bifunctional 2-methylcitrate synthase/citrate synthase [Cryobacterium]TFC94058.1 bifunctional 2-methylcitrate synthase/citrate synthase [Cryobacterium sp. TmT3-12]TFC98711.1 bifunctional 2-methylcitrate synthase/citrate synthase [Cryobacterium breve]
MSQNEPTVFKGLAGVVVDRTQVSKVNPESNSLLYRGYPVQELAAQKSFEEVAYLLWHGELPTDAELGEFEEQERSLRHLAPAVKRLIDELPMSAHPMDVVRTAVSLIGANDPEAADASPAANRAKGLRLWAQMPSIVAYDQRRRHGLDLIEPRSDLGYSANFLFMTFGEVPELVVVNAFDVSMIMYAEHSFNASTFTARVITSTLSDLHSAVTGAIGALKGALHGGANEAVMHIFDEIGLGLGAGERAEAWLNETLAAKRKVMGFGHRVYKHGDSRVPTMRTALVTLVEHYERPDLLELYESLEEGMTTRTGILPNLDYPSGPAYHLMGFDTLTFTPIFVAARLTGWTAHIIEQAASNALIRPLSLYDGHDERHLA